MTTPLHDTFLREDEFGGIVDAFHVEVLDTLRAEFAKDGDHFIEQSLRRALETVTSRAAVAADETRALRAVFDCGDKESAEVLLREVVSSLVRLQASVHRAFAVALVAWSAGHGETDAAGVETQHWDGADAAKLLAHRRKAREERKDD